MAVCGDHEALEQEEAYLLLDHDRRVFDECEDLAENVELLRDEVRRMQESEAQAFQHALNLHKSEISYLRAQVRRAETQTERSEARVRNLEGRIREMENAFTWRLFEPYRRLRTRVDAVRARARNRTGQSDGRPG
jgi:septal ring factor EnvC (AmiA/AmiB activator)